MAVTVWQLLYGSYCMAVTVWQLLYDSYCMAVTVWQLLYAGYCTYRVIYVCDNIWLNSSKN